MQVKVFNYSSRNPEKVSFTKAALCSYAFDSKMCTSHGNNTTIVFPCAVSSSKLLQMDGSWNLHRQCLWQQKWCVSTHVQIMQLLYCKVKLCEFNRLMVHLHLQVVIWGYSLGDCHCRWLSLYGHESSHFAAEATEWLQAGTARTCVRRAVSGTRCLLMSNLHSFTGSRRERYIGSVGWLSLSF